MLDFLRPSLKLIVTRLGRLGRSIREVLNIVHECDQRKASLTFLEPMCRPTEIPADLLINSDHLSEDTHGPLSPAELMGVRFKRRAAPPRRVHWALKCFPVPKG
nr:recombinase family protein [Bosea sp. BIWAKO-01]